MVAAGTGLFVGALVDRFQIRTIVTIDNGLRTVIFGLIPLLFWLGRLYRLGQTVKTPDSDHEGIG